MRRNHPIWIAALLPALFCGSLAFAGDVAVTYTAPTDLTVRQKSETPPPASAGAIIRDPAYGSRILRVTDPNVQSTAPGTSFRGPAESFGHNWNADSTMFWVYGNGGILPYHFDASTMTAKRVESPGNPSDGLFLPFSGPFSYRLPNILYGNRNLQIVAYDFNTGQSTPVFDATAALPGAASGSAEPSVSDDDNKLCLTFSGAPGTFRYVAVLDRATGKYSVLDARNSRLNGAPTNLPLGFGIGKAYIDRSGTYVLIAKGPATTNNAWVVWNLQTSLLSEIADLQGGPDAAGFGLRINESGYNGSFNEPIEYAIRSLDNPGSAKYLIDPNLTPTPHLPVAHGSFSWNNALPDTLVPIVAAHYRQQQDGGQPWRAWDGEIIAVATDGSSRVWRFAHHHAESADPRPSVSQDGRWCLFTSNWDGTLGNDPSGNPRRDVFLVELSAASTTLSQASAPDPAPTKLATSAAVPARFTPLAAVTAAATAPVTYSSPYCGPLGGSTSWACGAWPSTTPPALGAAGTTVQDPDTKNRVLRVTQRGSFGEAAGTAFKVHDGGWKRVWNASSTRLLAFSWSTGAVKNTANWVQFNPATMTVTGSTPIPYQFTDVEWDQSNPDVVVGIASGAAQTYNVVTKAWTRVFDPASTGWGAKSWSSGWGGSRVCIAEGPQNSGYRLACYDRSAKASQVIDLRAQTINGKKFAVYFKGSTATIGTGVVIHAITVAPGGGWLAVDIHGGSPCSAGSLTNYATTSLFIDLQAGVGYEWNIACGGTHWAYGYNNVLAQGASPRWTSLAASGPCNSDSRGVGLRHTNSTIDSSFLFLEPCLLFSVSTWNVNVHLSWNNNVNDANVNKYPLLLATNNGGIGNSFLWNDIAALQMGQPAYQAKLWRFAQTWNDLYSNQCGFLDYASPAISPDGKWAAFLSDWRGQTGAGVCTNNKRTDVFVFELK